MTMSSNALSAEAAEFVPHAEPDRPNYIYNCYPFVSPDQTQYRGRGVRHPGANNGALVKPGHMMCPRTILPVSHYTSHHVLHPQHDITSQHHIFPRHGDMYRSPYYTVNGPHATTYPPNLHYRPMSPLVSIPAHSSLAPRTDNWYSGAEKPRQNSKPAKQTKHQPSRESNRKQISVGTQNEGSSKFNRNKTTKPNSCRTIILMDMAVQTDFAADIADRTLEQVPNALYQGKRKTRRKAVALSRPGANNDSTDSEELDHSDSGYSSPMHRKNLISSGTDARNKNLEPSTQIQTQTNPQTAQSTDASLLYSSKLKQTPSSTDVIQRPDTPPVDLAADDNVPQTKKRKRKRGRRRKKNKGENGSKLSDGENQDNNQHSNTEICDSPILSQESPVNLLAPDTIDANFPSFSDAGLYDDRTDCRLPSGKRKKRREQANKAALVEQLEIDLEQQAIKVVNQTPVSLNKPANSGKKSQQSVSINLLDILQPHQPQLAAQSEPISIPKPTAVRSAAPSAVLNPLDSSAPNIKRGKERETPKVKKPSPLKKVILKEREERKRLRYMGEGVFDLISTGTPESSLHFTSEPEENDEDGDVISDLDIPSTGTGERGSMTPASQDLSPISQNSPISVGLLSPASGSLSYRACDSPTVITDIVHKIHSRRFREYCNQVLDKEIDGNCTSLLQTLVKFQDRLYHKDPIKAKSKRRLVLGLREVTKHLKLRRIKLVIISPNLEKIQSKGGLDDALNMIINLCSEHDVPFVFALGRRSLGRACAKLVPVSVVGIFNYQGAETMYNELIELTKQAREAYHEMVAALAKEVAEYGAVNLLGSSGLLYSHMGHSRTPSGCSAISFASSILSEPAERTSDTKQTVNQTTVSNNNNTEIADDICEEGSAPLIKPAQSSPTESRAPIQDDIYDIDEGNEADTEDNDVQNTLSSSDGSQTALKNNSDSRNADESEITTAVNNLNIKEEVSELSRSSERRISSHRRNNSLGVLSLASSSRTDIVDGYSGSVHSSATVEGQESDIAGRDSVLSNSNGARSLHNLDRVKNWVREVDSSPTTPTISQDDVEFNATYTACAANSDALISRSRSPSVSITQPQ